MNESPIIILGFGRSGTTWVSDIVSKMLGGLILFEPFHPAVYQKADIALYQNGLDKQLLKDTKAFTTEFLSKKVQNKWLLRNHLSSNLDEVNTQFVNEVWSNCDVIGYKSIRQNFIIPELYESVSKRIVFLKRDLLSVIGSLLRRERFWEEFGFPFHEEKFLKETLYSSKYNYLDKKGLINLYNGLQEDYLKMTFIWVLSHIIVEDDCKKLNIPIFYYKDFYLDPYNTAQQLASYLNEKVSLHPSYIFTPSMLTLRTFHKTEDQQISEKSLEKFWVNTLSSTMVSAINELENTILKFKS